MLIKILNKHTPPQLSWVLFITFRDGSWSLLVGIFEKVLKAYSEVGLMGANIDDI